MSEIVSEIAMIEAHAAITFAILCCKVGTRQIIINIGKRILYHFLVLTKGS